MASTSKITIDGIKYDIRDDYLREQLETKQDKLTAGEGITISEDGTISVVEQE